MTDKKNIISVRLAGQPVPQPRHRVYMRGGKLHTYQAPRSHPIHAYKDSLRLMARGEMGTRPPISAPLLVVAEFGCKNVSTVGDIDNLLKAVLDSLNGIVWQDDRWVSRVVAEKRTADESFTRLTVRLTKGRLI
jgi:Holliday junction resolvase RusA-like endonuclease